MTCIASIKRVPWWAVVLVSPAALAQEAGAASDPAATSWLLTSTALVLFMTLPGLALFYGGLVRSKNVLSVLMQCFVICCVASVLWAVAGYGLAFGDGGGLNAVIGGGKWFLDGIGLDAVRSGVPETVFLAFQMTFAIITPALIIGSFAERMRFTAMLWFTVLWLLLVYVPVCHWVWGGGWLMERGFLDFAGGTVVHVNAGTAAIVAALVLGARRGFPTTAMPPHNMTLTVAGAAMLWVGWFGFNAGSALAANASAGMALLVTHLAAAAGSLAWMTAEWWRFGKPSVLGVVTGMVAGLGTITPASGYVGPMAGLCIGALAGVVCYFATQLIKRQLRIDDSLDVFPVHGVGGALGTICAGLFAMPALGGRGLAEGVTVAGQVLLQAVGVVAIALWCGAVTFLILKVLGQVTTLRVSAEQETGGLDLAEHNERGYSF
ncbi:MAG: ammonium transporter [Gammaproteobacteria bacterium]|nr:ammonium transporter [Gammaproteobacteria bacterium]